MKNIIEIISSNNLLKSEGPAPAETSSIINETDPSIYGGSVCFQDGCAFMLKKVKNGRKLIIISKEGKSDRSFIGDSYEITSGNTVYQIKECDTVHVNAIRLREVFPFTRPSVLGTATSFGMGDRLGIATPGHIRAARGFKFFPILPQQSIREMTRTGRTPDNVMDDACWGVFQEGFRKPFGADADHLKTEDDARLTAAAGFTFFTIDPSDHLNLAADTMPPAELSAAFDALFPSSADKSAFTDYYSKGEFILKHPKTGESHTFVISGADLIKIAVKYLPAVRHTIRLHNLLCDIKGGRENFDLEMSVDETSSPTTPEEHLFVALELKRGGIAVQSLAPRYVGEFQKGIDYIGDIAKLEASLRLHALVAAALGPYKLSIHSGSDKFSIFPLFGKLTGGMFHEKTAGTSYLEAIRVITAAAPDLYREIHTFALSRFETDRASYHVTTDLSKIPDLKTLKDAELPSLMDRIDPRQLIHITYGSVLTEKKSDGSYMFYDRIMDVLDRHETEHYAGIVKHFRRHIDALGIEKE